MNIKQLNRANDIQQQIKWLNEDIALINKYDCARVGWEIAYDNFKAMNFLDKEMVASIKKQMLDFIDNRIKILEKEFEQL